MSVCSVPMVLTDLCNIERAVSGKAYPAGTVYIQVSACNHSGDDPFLILKEPAALPSKYAVLIPKLPCVPGYLFHLCNNFAAEFRAKIIGDNINIQMDSFRFFECCYHPDLEYQKKTVRLLDSLADSASEEEQIIAHLVNVKAYMLDRMFPEMPQEMPEPVHPQAAPEAPKKKTQEPEEEPAQFSLF